MRRPRPLARRHGKRRAFPRPFDLSAHRRRSVRRQAGVVLPGRRRRPDRGHRGTAVSESSQIIEVTPAEVRHMVVGEQRSVEPAGLYLDLLKKALTNTIYTAEPGEESEAAFVRGFIDHYIQGPAVSMLPLARFDNLQFCIDDVLKKGVPGDLIETGVWRGGATIFMRAMLKARSVTDRLVWVADSFEGLPEPDADRFPIEAETHNGAL